MKQWRTTLIDDKFWRRSLSQEWNDAPILHLLKLIDKGGVAGCLFLFRDIITVVTTRIRDMSQYNAVDGSAILQIAYLIVCLFYISYHLTRSSRKEAIYLLLFTTPIGLLVIYTGLCGLSSLWSSYFRVTTYRSIECFAYILLIAIICDNLNFHCSRQDLIEWLVFWGIWHLFWDVARFIRIMGPSAIFSFHIFSRGAMTLAVLFFLIIFLSKRKAFVLISLVFTFLSMANKTYFGLFLGSIPGLYLGDRRFHTVLFFLIGVIVMSFLLYGLDVLQSTLFYGKEGVGMEYTTGRDKIWKHSFRYGMKRFICGYGFVTGEMEAVQRGRLGAISAHNVFLSAFLSVGILGPILFILFFAWLAILSIRSDIPLHWKSSFIATTVMIFIISCTAPGLGARVYGSWIPAVFTSLAMCTVIKSDFLKQLNTAGLYDDLACSTFIERNNTSLDFRPFA